MGQGPQHRDNQRSIQGTGWRIRLLAVLCAAIGLVIGAPATAGAGSVGKATATESNPCLKTGTARPRVLEAVVRHPGDKKTQSIKLDAAWPAMPDQCHGNFRRVLFVKFQLENPDRFKIRTPKNRWLNVNSFRQPRFIEFLDPEASEGRKKPARIGDEGGVGHLEFKPAYPLGRIYNKTKRYRCTPGKRITHARALVKNVLKNTADSKTAGTRIFPVPLEIKRSYKGAKGLSTPKKMRGATGEAC